MFTTKNLGTRLDLWKGVYINGFYSKTKSRSQNGGEMESRRRKEHGWRALGGWARHCSSSWLCPLSGLVLWRGVLSDDKNDLGILSDFFGNIFCVTFSESQKQSNASDKYSRNFKFKNKNMKLIKQYLFWISLISLSF